MLNALGRKMIPLVGKRKQKNDLFIDKKRSGYSQDIGHEEILKLILYLEIFLLLISLIYIFSKTL